MGCAWLRPAGAVVPCQTRPGAGGAGPAVWWPPRHAGRTHGVWTRSMCPIAAARSSRRGAWGLESRPRQAFGFLVRQAAVCDHDRDALRPGLVLVRRHREGLASRRCCRPRAHRQHPRRPGFADILAPPIGCRGEHCHPLPPQHGLAGKLTPLLLPRGISIEGEDEITHPSDPIPPPALHTEERHHTRHARCQERQRITGALAAPQRPATCLQRGRVYVWSSPWHFLWKTSLRDCLVWLVASR